MGTMVGLAHVGGHLAVWLLRRTRPVLGPYGKAGSRTACRRGGNSGRVRPHSTNDHHAEID